jgi:hypothetical protein
MLNESIINDKWKNPKEGDVKITYHNTIKN